MKREFLYEAIGEVREEWIEEAAEPGRRRRVWPVALAACLALAIAGGGFLLSRSGANHGASGSSGGGGYGGPGVYEGPILPLTLAEEDGELLAEREVVLDFEPWTRVWLSNEDEVNSRGNLNEEEKAALLNQYNEWYPEGGRWLPSGDILVTDTTAIRNTSAVDKTVTVLYPFSASLNALYRTRPTLTVDGVETETTLLFGGYASTEGMLSPRSDWGTYRELLSDGGYLQSALSPAPSLKGQTVTVYEFTDAWGPQRDGERVPNPTIRVDFDLDYAATKVLTSGFNGGRYDRENGHMVQSYSISAQAEDGGAMYIIAVGGELTDMTTGCYVTGGTDADTPRAEGGVTVTRYEADLDDVLRKIVSGWAERRRAGAWAADADPDPVELIGFEAYYGLFVRWLTGSGMLSDDGCRYGSSLEDNNILSATRVCYLSARVTIPAGGEASVRAELRKPASFRDAGGEQRFELATRLGSNLVFTAQSAVLKDRGLVQITSQDFGFAPDEGVVSVALSGDTEVYALYAVRIPE